MSLPDSLEVPEVCPVRGCTASGWATMKQFRGHVNGKPDAAHEWKQVRPMLDGAEDDDADDDADDTEEEDTDMASQSEYEEQHNGDGGDDDGDADDGSTDGDGGPMLPSAPVDPRTLMLLVAVAAVGYVAYRAMTSDEGGDTPATGDPDAGVENQAETTATGPGAWEE